VSQVFVSDLHLDGAQPEAIDLFVEFLARDAVSARALYILGDLFETWLGDDLADPARERVCRALRDLTQGGVAVFVMRGNRDFLLDTGFEQRTGCQLLPDPVLLHLDGRNVLLTHGDLLCTGDRGYQQLRTLTHDTRWRGRLLSLQPAARTALAALARAGSRRHMAQAANAIMDVEPRTVEKVFKASGADWMIHGHTHRPGRHEYQIMGSTRTRFVLDAWYQGGQCLWVDKGRIEERRFGRQQPA
jgi:UDP-2,3-diacylglucosamine hydrolase